MVCKASYEQGRQRTVDAVLTPGKPRGIVRTARLRGERLIGAAMVPTLPSIGPPEQLGRGAFV